MEISGESWCWAPLLKSRADGGHSQHLSGHKAKGKHGITTSPHQLFLMEFQSHGVGSLLGWDQRIDAPAHGDGNLVRTPPYAVAAL